MTRRLFTPEEDATIIAGYSQQTLKHLGTELGRDWHVIQQRVNVLIRQGKLSRRQRCYAPPWTEAEDDALADCWGRMPDRAVARKLRRTVTACQIRAKRHLGLARKQQFYTAREVGRVFGVDSKLVARWITEWKLLRGRPSAVRAGGNVAWQIEDQDIARFIRRSGWAYDRRRIEPGSYWRNLAEAAHQADPWLTTAEAATRLGMTASGVVQRINRGHLPAMRVPGGGGTHWRIRGRDVPAPAHGSARRGAAA